MNELDWSTVDREPMTHEVQYTWKDVVLYALGIGARIDELPFIYENVPGGLKVFPSFAVMAERWLIGHFAKQVEGNRFLHGEQMIRLHHPIPAQGEIISTGPGGRRLRQGQGRGYPLPVPRSRPKTGRRSSIQHVAFDVGAGGFGGDPGPKSEPLTPPPGIEPDFSLSYKVPENQAALYRLSGDSTACT